MSFQPQSLDLPSLKRLARHLRQAWTVDHTKHGDKAPSLARAQELLARTFGFPDWHAAQQALALPLASVPAPHELSEEKNRVMMSRHLADWSAKQWEVFIRTQVLSVRWDDPAFDGTSLKSADGLTLTVSRNDPFLWELLGQEAVRRHQWGWAGWLSRMAQRARWPMNWEPLTDSFAQGSQATVLSLNLNEVTDFLTLLSASMEITETRLVTMMALAHQVDHPGVAQLTQLCLWGLRGEDSQSTEILRTLGKIVSLQDKVTGMILLGVRNQDDPFALINRAIAHLDKSAHVIDPAVSSIATLDQLSAKVKENLHRGARQGVGRFSLEKPGPAAIP